MKKTLSIKQPWALLIARGIKNIENRTWRTQHRGRIYIHASGSHGKRFNVNLTDEQMIAAFGSIAKEKYNEKLKEMQERIKSLECENKYLMKLLEKK